jgi:tRNA A-37 threonylcarbamoyl transferase component Bud32
MGDSSRRSSEVYAPTLQRSGERLRDDSPAYPAGTVLAGRYCLDRPLGQGGMGRVYEGTHVALGRRIAVKVLLRRYADQPAMVERFRNEARSQSRISHPNVLPVFDYGSTDAGEPFLAMDLLEGEPLSHLVKGGPLPLDRMLTILHQVALALRAAHTAGVVHRDLKPANVFVLRGAPSEPTRVQVLDFGMAKLVENAKDEARLTAAGEILGTPEYMAPEQAASGEVDRRTDIYAFGCVAYELWCGVPPFSGSSYVQVLAKQLDEKPKSISESREAPAALEALVARALAKSKDDRPRDMDEVLKALEAVADEEGIASLAATVPAEATVPHASTPSMKASRVSGRRGFFRRRTRRAAIALGLVLFGASLGAVGWRKLGPPPPRTGGSTLVITTLPTGAAVSVDGRALAETTPTVAEVQPGHHTIDARLAHYKPITVEREVKPAESNVIRMPLVKDTYKLHVTSEPAGAQLSFDGFSAGITPADVDVDPLDAHTIRLERLGRKPWETLLGEGDRRTEVHAALKKKDDAE